MGVSEMVGLSPLNLGSAPSSKSAGHVQPTRCDTLTMLTIY